MEHSNQTKKENDENSGLIITLDTLSRAIANKTGLSISSATEDANIILDFFGYDDRIIDNVLMPQERQLFYLLEEEGMLKTARMENELYNGKTWRTHFWEIQKEKILLYSKDEDIERLVFMKKEKDIYDGLDDEIWIRKKK